MAELKLLDGKYSFGLRWSMYRQASTDGVQRIILLSNFSLKNDENPNVCKIRVPKLIMMPDDESFKCFHIVPPGGRHAFSCACMKILVLSHFRQEFRWTSPSMYRIRRGLLKQRAEDRQIDLLKIDEISATPLSQMQQRIEQKFSEWRKRCAIWDIRTFTVAWQKFWTLT
jgi:hypothetical protein